MNLFIGNLGPDVTASDLQTAFSEFGEVVSAKVIFDNQTGMSKGFGFVEMGDKFHAFDAIDNIDATFFMGQVISVKEAKAKAGPGGGNQRGGGFNRGGQRPGGGGFRSSGGGGGSYQKREGGYKPREGGYQPREGSSYTPRENYKPREGGSNGSSTGGYQQDEANGNSIGG